ncbi:MAG TPA: hypothetical protein VH763_05760 [Gemmatimonadales bacterium]|jgi:hypothetical protein
MYHRFRIGALALGLAAGGPLPKDPCALLKPAEIQAALAPDTKITAGVPTTKSLPLAVSCSYTWGPRTPQWGESSLLVMVIDLSQAWPGLSAEQIQQGVLLSAKGDKADASLITGVGDAGVFTSKAGNYNGRAEAVLEAKGVHLSVEFHGGEVLSHKDKIIALLKGAARRL